MTKCVNFPCIFHYCIFSFGATLGGIPDTFNHFFIQSGTKTEFINCRPTADTLSNFEEQAILAYFSLKSAFFNATPIQPPFFGVRRIQLNGIISSPYPEVTLYKFCFSVGGRLAARRAVSWPRLPKVALLGSKNATFLARNQFFVVSLKINCYNHNGTHKRQL